jgi:hypothetical protein
MTSRARPASFSRKELLAAQRRGGRAGCDKQNNVALRRSMIYYGRAQGIPEWRLFVLTNAETFSRSAQERAEKYGIR